MTRNDGIVAALLFALVTGATLAASTQQGIHRDEAYYMDAGERYVRWVEDAVSGSAPRPFSKEAIWEAWSTNREHPPFLKLLYGASWRLLHRCRCAQEPELHPKGARLDSGRHATLSLLDELSAFRLPTAACFGLLCALVYLWFVEALGTRLGALAAAALTFAQPRAFFHAQTASFDLPAAALWLATAWAWWRALGAGSWRTALLTGAVYGLFLATKLQSFFLPFVLGAHWGVVAWTRRRRGLARPTLAPLVCMATLGPALAFALWPLLWQHGLAHVPAYLSFHWNHVHYNFEYLGQNWNAPPFPWHEPLGMLVFTAPVVLLVLAVAGAALFARERLARGAGFDPRATGVLLLLTGAIPVALFLTGRNPIYGATKHWLATMPFLALAAGVAVDRLAAGLSRELQLEGRAARIAVAGALFVTAVAPAAVETLRSHPYGLSHYNALAGGPAGGAVRGLIRLFWGSAAKGVLPWLDRELPAQARVFFHDANHDSIELYRRAGEIRPGLVEAPRSARARSLRGSDAGLVVHEKHFAEVEIELWNAYGHLRPQHVLTLDGVPLVTVYLRHPPQSP